MAYTTLDDLAHDFKPGDTIFYKAGTASVRSPVMGYVFSLPKFIGGNDEPALIVGPNGGHVYPEEVYRHVGLRGGKAFDHRRSPNGT